jgi:hypothetical protein
MISLAAVRRGELVVNDAIKRVREPVNEFGESQEGSAAHDDCCAVCDQAFGEAWWPPSSS